MNLTFLNGLAFTNNTNLLVCCLRNNQSYSVACKLKVLRAIDKNLLFLKDSSIKFNMANAAIIVK